MILEFLPYDLVLKLLRLPPLPETGETEAVVAVGQDPEPGLAPGFVHDGLHADAAGLVLGPGHCERVLHVLLVLPQAGLMNEEKPFVPNCVKVNYEGNGRIDVKHTIVARRSNTMQICNYHGKVPTF